VIDNSMYIFGGIKERNSQDNLISIIKSEDFHKVKPKYDTIEARPVTEGGRVSPFS
jgi:hypothetical protein